MDRKKKSVRILLVGSEGCGKTSLILTLVSEEFPSTVPNCSEIITIPADVTPEGVLTHIVDYSEKEQNEDDLVNEITKADVVCIVYSAENEASLQEVSSVWLPLLRNYHSDRILPVILVANKSDLLEVPGATFTATFKISEEFPEVVTCIECSAKNISNVSEMFYFAQKAVLYPIDTLYDAISKELKPDCVRALKRIFRLFDFDKDNVLSNEEISDFQKICFKKPFDKKGLYEFKTIIKQNSPDGLNSKGITFNGFKFIQQMFIQRGKQEVVWLVLRKFGYDDQLQLTVENFCPLQLLSEDDIINVDLSQSAIDYLTELFHQFDKDRDSSFNESELDELFSVCPINPFKSESLEYLSTNSNDYINLDGWLSYFITQTKFNYQLTLMYLAYLGFGGTDISTCSTALTILPKVHSYEFRSKFPSASYTCFVCGPPNSGKSSLLKRFIDKQGLVSNNAEKIFFHSARVDGVVSKCFPSNKVLKNRHLILKEVEWSETDYSLRNGMFDCMCFLYCVNDPNSIEMIESYAMEALMLKIPVIIIGTMADQPDLTQANINNSALFDGTFSNIIKLKWSFKWNSNDKNYRHFFEDLFSFVVFNEKGENLKQKIWKKICMPSERFLVKASAVAITAFLFSLLVIRLKKRGY